MGEVCVCVCVYLLHSPSVEKETALDCWPSSDWAWHAVALVTPVGSSPIAGLE